MSTPAGPGDDRSFAAWNEDMVRRYDIDRYYERSHFIVRLVERRRLALLRALAAPRPGERVLEVGVGGGHVLQQFAGTRRTGIDLSPLMLERARRRLGTDTPLARANAEALPFSPGSFDVVLCTEVLEHTRTPGAVLSELVRVAAPGGRIIVSIPNEAVIDGVKRALRRIPGLRRWLRSLADEGNEWHLHRFDLPLLRRIAQGTCELGRVRGIPLPWLPLRYAAVLRAPTPAASAPPAPAPPASRENG